jgi:hypothetical protein
MLSRIGNYCDAFRISLYVDDAALFIKPAEHDITIANHILAIFAEASDLVTNMGKIGFYPIQCDSVDLSFLTSRNLITSTFPYNYLGLPLHYRKPTRSMMQPVINKIYNMLPSSKRNLLSYPVR